MIITFSIVAYNSENLLDSCLDSIIKWSSLQPSKYEIIVVDNTNGQSADKFIVEKFTEKYNNIYIKFIESENKGYGAGNNIALKHAKGDIFCVINPDSKIIEPIDHRIIDHFTVSNDLLAVGCKQNSFINNTFFLRPEYSYPLLKSLVNTICKRYDYFNGKYMALSGALTFYDKHNLNDIGGFDEEYFLYCEESDISRRAKEKSFLLKYESSYCYVHMDGVRDVSLDHSLERTLSSVKLYFKKFGGSFMLYKTNLLLIIYIKIFLALFGLRFDLSYLKRQLSLIKSA